MFLQERGLEVGQIGRILSVASATLLVAPFLWGMLADRFVALNRLFAVLHLAGVASLWVLHTQSSFSGLLTTFTILRQPEVLGWNFQRC